MPIMVTNIWRAGIFLGLVVLAGCSGAVVNHGSKEEQNLRYIGRAYVQFTNKEGRPPADVEEIKPYLKEFGEPDTILRSPVDGQSYVIAWNTPLARTPAGQPEILLAYEKNGARGRRFVLNAGMFIHAMTDEEFNKAKGGP